MLRLSRLRNKQWLINVTVLSAELAQDLCSTLMSLHVFSGCEMTIAFRGVGKLKPLKSLMRQEQYVHVLKVLGEQQNISNELIDGLEDFTCRLCGRGPRITHVNELRLARINELCMKENRFIPSSHVDKGNIPPCKRTLLQHLRRVNYKVRILKRGNFLKPNIHKAYPDHG